MFEIGWTELLVIAVVAIVVIGPKDLPRAMRMVGQWTGRMKRMARDFQGQFNEALREAEIEGIQKDLKDIGKIDPLADVRNEMKKVGADLRGDLDKLGSPGLGSTPSMPPRLPDAGPPAPPPEMAPAAPAAPVAPPAKDLP